MSQLNVNAIYDASGGDSVDVFSENAAKAWVDYNQDTPAIAADFGVDSIADNSAGNFTITWTTAFASINYAIATHGGEEAATAVYIWSTAAPTTTTTQLQATNSSDVATDLAANYVVAFGDQ